MKRHILALIGLAVTLSTRPASAADWTEIVGYPSSRSNVSNYQIGGNTYFYGTTTNVGHINYTINPPHDGLYRVEAKVVADTDTSNSFYVTTAQTTSELVDQTTWHISPPQTGPRWVDVGQTYLQSGQQELVFHVREAGTDISDVKITLVNDAQTLHVMPFGVPKETEGGSACFLEGEREFATERFATVELSGCDGDVIDPPTVLTVYNRYKDDNGDGVKDVSCNNLRKSYLGSGWVDVYTEELQAHVNSTPTDNPNASGVLCAVNMFYHWAKKEPLISLGGDEHQAELSRQWNLGRIASTYFSNPQVRQRALGQYAGSITKADVISNWLEDLSELTSEKVLEFKAVYDQEGTDWRYYVVNTNFWRAYAMTVSALISGNDAHLSIARDVFIEGMRQVSREGDQYDWGFLPFELEREKRALHYHSFALFPLAGMAALSQSYGCDFVSSEWRSNQLTYLSRKVIEGHYDEGVFESKFDPQIEMAGGTDSRPVLKLLKGLTNEGATVHQRVVAFLDEHADCTNCDASGSNNYDRLGGDLSRLMSRVGALKIFGSSTLCQ